MTSLKTLLPQIHASHRDPRIAALTAAKKLPDQDKAKIINAALIRNDPTSNRYLLGLLDSMQDHTGVNITPLIFLALTKNPADFCAYINTNMPDRPEAVKVIEYLPKDVQEYCLQTAFNTLNLHVAKEAHKLVTLHRTIPTTLTLNQIQPYLDSEDVLFGINCIPLLADQGEQVRLLWKYYNDSDEQRRNFAARYASILFNNGTEEQRKAVEERTPTLETYTLQDHPLYKDVLEDFFTRKQEIEFAKEGSRLILLGGPAAGTEIIRIITPEAYEAWERAWTSKIWQNRGFNYIPIEPIYEAKKVNGLMEVRCGVLDLPLSQIMKYRNFFPHVPELRAQKARILETLDDLHIDHGHPHNNNFCVKLHENLNQRPNLYMIDFDQARKTN